MKNIILIAPPAAGKGTLAAMLKEKYNIPHISTGDILRDVAQRNDEIGMYVQETMSTGAFVKDEIIYQLLEERLSQSDCQNGYILDGFPRNMEQAKKYEEILKTIKQNLGVVIILDVDKDILKKRITGRRICRNCDAIFNINIEGNRPQEDSICDYCHGPLYQRSDDNLEAFENRYQTYLKITEPLVDYYNTKGIVYHVDGSSGKEKLLSEVEKIVLGSK